MKKIFLAVVLSGFNPLMAAQLEDLKTSADNALTASLKDGIKNAAVPPEPKAVEVSALNKHKPGNVFTSGIRWSRDYQYPKAYSLLEQLGVRKSAENDAIYDCQAAGFLNCVATGSRIITCGEYFCSADGSAASLVPVPGAAVFSMSKELHLPEKFSELDQLGVRKSAENDAINKCKAKGLSGCVVVVSSLDFCDKRVCNNSCEGTVYSCKATAQVQSRTHPK